MAYVVPQGTILFLMLFNIYIKLLGEVVRGFELKYHQYATIMHALISSRQDYCNVIYMGMLLKTVQNFGQSRMQQFVS